MGRWLVFAEPVLAGNEVRRWLTVATRQSGAAEQLARGVVHTAARLLGVVDLARDAMRAGERALRAELLDQLLDPSRTVDVPGDRFASFGFDADREARIALLVSDGLGESGAPADVSDASRVARVVETAAQTDGCPCLVARRRGLLTILFQERERDIEDWVARLAADGFEPLAGIGRAFRGGGGGALASLRDAELALDHLRRASQDGGQRSLRFEDFGLAEWLLASAEPHAVEEKAAALLQPLRAHAELYRTLLAWLELDLDVPATARALHLHENSLRYRLRRIEAVLGRSLREGRTIVDLYLATTSERTALDVRAQPAKTDRDRCRGTMKAIVQDTYGSAGVLELRDIDTPVVGDDELLLRVHAAGVGPDVWHLMTGLPYLVRVMGNGLRAPKRRIRGWDVAGRVETVGKNVTRAPSG